MAAADCTRRCPYGERRNLVRIQVMYCLGRRWSTYVVLEEDVGKFALLCCSPFFEAKKVF